MTIVDLQNESIAEARRLTRTRSLMRRDDVRAAGDLASGGPWVAMPRRRRRLRQSFGRRVCLVWRVAFEDPAGQVVESRLVPVLASLPRHRVDRAWMRSILVHTDGAVKERVEAESKAWRAEVLRVTAAFTAARLVREREIAAARTATMPRSQPGLFDRRADRARDAGVAARAEAERAAAERLRTVTASGLVTAIPPRVLLVLVP
jgi:hypothetical protein